MHVAFALMIGWPLAQLVRSARRCGCFWFAVPVLVTFVIVVTANHFVVDAVLGALTAAVRLRRLARARGRRVALRRPAVGVRAARPRPAWPLCRDAPAGAAATERPRAPRARRERREVVRNRADRVAADAERDLAHRLALNVVAAVLVLERLFFLGGVAFIVGSVCDTLDGRYSRMSGKGTPFGAFLDSTLDRIEEGIVLAAVAVLLRRCTASASGRRRGRRRRARLADGQLHPRPRRGARRRVQGRHRDARRCAS